MAEPKDGGVWVNGGALWDAFEGSSYTFNGELNVGDLLLACHAAAARGEAKLKVYVYENTERKGDREPTYRLRIPLPKKE